MKQETKRLTSIIIAAIIFAAAIMTYFEFIVPSYTNLETLKGQEQSEKTLYANEIEIVSKVKSLLTTYQGDSSSSQLVAMALPVGPDISGALAQIYGLATNAGIVMQGAGISVQAVQAMAQPTSEISVGSGQIASAAAAGSIVKPMGSVSFQITGSGSYEALKDFLQGLSTNIRIFNVTGISIQPAAVVATKTQPANTDMFNYTITVVTYYQAS